MFIPSEHIRNNSQAFPNLESLRVVVFGGEQIGGRMIFQKFSVSKYYKFCWKSVYSSCNRHNLATLGTLTLRSLQPFSRKHDAKIITDTKVSRGEGRGERVLSAINRQNCASDVTGSFLHRVSSYPKSNLAN